MSTNNDLRTIWREINTEAKHDNEVSIGEIINRSHCKIISIVLSDQRKRMLLYLVVFLVYLGLMGYAFIYLRLTLSTMTIVVLLYPGLFLFLKTISEINRFRLFLKTADDISVRESVISFRKSLNTIGSVDFIISLIFSYVLAIGVMVTVFQDKGIAKWLIPLVVILVLVLFAIPWFMNYMHQKRYNKLYANLRNSVSDLE